MGNKIGILTFHGADNYGSVLQSFALVKFLKKCGHNAEIINYNFEHDYRNYNLFRTHMYFQNPKSFFSDLYLLRPHLRRRNAFERFRNEHLIISNTVYDDANLHSANEVYDTFICGSDQIWNLDCTDGISPAYFLKFVGENKKKIAYAPSMGSCDLEKYDLDQLRKAVYRLDYVAVREASMQEKYQELCMDKKISLVLDPTLLLDMEDYQELLRIAPESKSRYVFIYILGGTKFYNNIIDYALNYAAARGLEVKYVFDSNNGKAKPRGVDCSGCSPCEFLSLIKSADHVFSNSFHATVFSVLFGRQFTSFARGNASVRILDLLKLIELENCYYTNANPEHENIDNERYRTAKLKLAALKKESFSFLEYALAE